MSFQFSNKNKSALNKSSTASGKVRVKPLISAEKTQTPRFSTTSVSQAYAECSVNEQKARKLETEIDGIRSEIKLLNEHLKIAEEQFNAAAAENLGVPMTRTFETASYTIGNEQRKRAEEVANLKNESNSLKIKLESLEGILSENSMKELREELKTQRLYKETVEKDCNDNEKKLKIMHERIQELRETESNKELIQQKDAIDLLHEKIHNEVEKHRNLKYIASAYAQGIELNEEEVDKYVYVETETEIKQLEDYLEEKVKEYEQVKAEYDRIIANDDFSTMLAINQEKLEQRTRALEMQQKQQTLKQKDEFEDSKQSSSLMESVENNEKLCVGPYMQKISTKRFTDFISSYGETEDVSIVNLGEKYFAVVKFTEIGVAQKAANELNGKPVLGVVVNATTTGTKPANAEKAKKKRIKKKVKKTFLQEEVTNVFEKESAVIQTPKKEPTTKLVLSPIHDEIDDTKQKQKPKTKQGLNIIQGIEQKLQDSIIAKPKQNVTRETNSHSEIVKAKTKSDDENESLFEKPRTIQRSVLRQQSKKKLVLLSDNSPMKKGSPIKNEAAPPKEKTNENNVVDSKEKNDKLSEIVMNKKHGTNKPIVPKPTETPSAVKGRKLESSIEKEELKQKETKENESSLSKDKEDDKTKETKNEEIKEKEIIKTLNEENTPSKKDNTPVEVKVKEFKNPVAKEETKKNEIADKQEQIHVKESETPKEFAEEKNETKSKSLIKENQSINSTNSSVDKCELAREGMIVTEENEKDTLINLQQTPLFAPLMELVKGDDEKKETVIELKKEDPLAKNKSEDSEISVSFSSEEEIKPLHNGQKAEEKSTIAFEEKKEDSDSGDFLESTKSVKKTEEEKDTNEKENNKNKIEKENESDSKDSSINLENIVDEKKESKDLKNEPSNDSFKSTKKEEIVEEKEESDDDFSESTKSTKKEEKEKKTKENPESSSLKQHVDESDSDSFSKSTKSAKNTEVKESDEIPPFGFISPFNDLVIGLKKELGVKENNSTEQKEIQNKDTEKKGESSDSYDFSESTKSKKDDIIEKDKNESFESTKSKGEKKVTDIHDENKETPKKESFIEEKEFELEKEEVKDVSAEKKKESIVEEEESDFSESTKSIKYSNEKEINNNKEENKDSKEELSNLSKSNESKNESSIEEQKRDLSESKESVKNETKVELNESSKQNEENEKSIDPKEEKSETQESSRKEKSSIHEENAEIIKEKSSENLSLRPQFAKLLGSVFDSPRDENNSTEERKPASKEKQENDDVSVHLENLNSKDKTSNVGEPSMYEMSESNKDFDEESISEIKSNKKKLALLRINEEKDQVNASDTSSLSLTIDFPNSVRSSNDKKEFSNEKKSSEQNEEESDNETKEEQNEENKVSERNIVNEQEEYSDEDSLNKVVEIKRNDENENESNSEEEARKDDSVPNESFKNITDREDLKEYVNSKVKEEAKNDVSITKTENIDSKEVDLKEDNNDDEKEVNDNSINKKESDIREAENKTNIDKNNERDDIGEKENDAEDDGNEKKDNSLTDEEIMQGLNENDEREKEEVKNGNVLSMRDRILRQMKLTNTGDNSEINDFGDSDEIRISYNSLVKEEADETRKKNNSNSENEDLSLDDSMVVNGAGSLASLNDF